MLIEHSDLCMQRLNVRSSHNKGTQFLKRMQSLDRDQAAVVRLGVADDMAY